MLLFGQKELIWVRVEFLSLGNEFNIQLFRSYLDPISRLEKMSVKLYGHLKNYNITMDVFKIQEQKKVTLKKYFFSFQRNSENITCTK